MWSNTDRPRAIYDASTGTFQSGRDHHHLHGQLDDVERFCRETLRAIAVQRARMAEEQTSQRLAALP